MSGEESARSGPAVPAGGGWPRLAQASLAAAPDLVFSVLWKNAGLHPRHALNSSSDVLKG